MSMQVQSRPRSCTNLPRPSEGLKGPLKRYNTRPLRPQFSVAGAGGIALKLAAEFPPRAMLEIEQELAAGGGMQTSAG